MPSPVARAVSSALALSRGIRGEEITYTRDSQTIPVAKAVRGSTVWDSVEVETGLHIQERMTDWIISATDTDGDSWTPQRDDIVTDENGVKFRVMPLGDTDQVWQWHDRGRTFYRIHSKERAS